MRRFLMSALLCIVCATPLWAGTVRTFDQEFERGDVERLRLEVPVGEIEIRGVDGDRIVVEARVRCGRRDSRCRDDAEFVELEARERRGELRLHFDGLDDLDGHDISIDIEVRLPADLALELDLGVGDLTLGEMSGDVRADVGVGEVRIRTQEKYVASVDLEVGVGEASMRPDPRRRSRDRWWGIKLGDDLRWDDGVGNAHIRIDVGVGDIDVRLR